MSVENRAGAWQLAEGTKISKQAEGHMVPTDVVQTSEQEPERSDLDMTGEVDSGMALAAMQVILEQEESESTLAPDSIKSY